MKVKYESFDSFLGESAVGKSSLVLRFVKGQFHEYQESTIGGKTIYRYINLFIYLFIYSFLLQI